MNLEIETFGETKVMRIKEDTLSYPSWESFSTRHTHSSSPAPAISSSISLKFATSTVRRWVVSWTSRGT
jgi:hypothetical protein